MIKIFSNYDDLKKFIGDDCICIGSNEGSFILDKEGKKFGVEVKSTEVEGDYFKHTYILNQI